MSWFAIRFYKNSSNSSVGILFKVQLQEIDDDFKFDDQPSSAGPLRLSCQSKTGLTWLVSL